MMKTVRTLAMTVAVVFLATMAAHAVQEKWTFMVYMDADNDLESYITSDIETALAVPGSSPDVNVVTLADGYNGKGTLWKTAKFFYVTGGMQATAANAVGDWGERNMADPQTLMDFVAYCRTNYPADHYALSFWDHGGAATMCARIGPAATVGIIHVR